MNTLTIKFPKSIEIDAKQARILLASSLFEKGKISLGEAAELCELSVRSFIDILSTLGISIFNQSSDDLEADTKNAIDHHI
jgi:predicted HTH domain antitoxin